MTTSPLFTHEIADSSLTDEAQTSQSAPTLYERDYFAWIEITLGQLQKQNYDGVDWDNLIEEIEGMGRREKRRLKNNLVVVLLHLLKWQYQSNRRSKSWASSIVEHRGRIQDDLADSPSLKPYLDEIYESAYARALKRAALETGLPETEFPADCSYAIAQILDDDFLPE